MSFASRCVLPGLVSVVLAAGCAERAEPSSRQPSTMGGGAGEIEGPGAAGDPPTDESEASWPPLLTQSSWVVTGAVDPSGQPLAFEVEGEWLKSVFRGTAALDQAAKWEELTQGEAPQLVRAGGRVALTPFIDSHVHLSYSPVGEALGSNGVFAAVDLAAPRSSLGEPPDGLDLIAAGPMLTAEGGYPTMSWGRNGYGWELSDVAEARSAAETLLAEGARVLKIPFRAGPDLSEEQVSAIVEVAHQAGVRVAAHALSNTAARRAAELGCDVLAHTPTEALDPEVIELWSERAVISTLVAFGASAAAKDNLARLRAAGASILYGTDLGNLRTSSVAPSELRNLQEVGLSPSEVLAALGQDAARYWGLSWPSWQASDEASFVLVDPTFSLTTEEVNWVALAEPDWVVRRGRGVGP